MKKSLLVLLLVLQMGSWAFAVEGYFTVKEVPVVEGSEPTRMDPWTVAEEIWDGMPSDLTALAAAIYSLVDFDFHAQKFGDVNEPYQRQKHFGAWVVDPRTKSCMNTRSRVLARDSAVPVQMRPNGCTVQSGSWADPYSGRDYSEARDLQIDHFVPLKNAYLSGAFKWTREKRCLYANFMGNPFHLLPVLGRENGSKGDRTPEGYMPPNPAYQCQYLSQWLKVKLIWSLALTTSEKNQVLNLLRSNHCPSADMTYTVAELEQQRRFIADNMGLCH